MKQFSVYFLALTLMFIGCTKVMAQSECPDIEWMRFYNSNLNLWNSIYNVDNHNSELVVGYYAEQLAFGSFNLPAPNSASGNAYIGKIDSIGNPLWVNVAENFTTAGGGLVGFSQPFVDSSGNIYTVYNFVWKTVFAGTTYTTNPWQQNALFIKMSPQGQVLSTHLFEGIDLFLNHIDQNLNIYCSSTFEDSILIDNHTYTSNGGSDVLVFKLSPQFQLLWAQQIGGNKDEIIPWVNGFISHTVKADSQNNIYITGGFESSSITLGSFVLNNSGNTDPWGNHIETFMAKINANGNYVWAKSIADPDFTPSAMEIDEDGNVYLAGYGRDTVMLGNQMIPIPTYSLNTMLVKYNPSADNFSFMVLREGGSNSGDLLYLPQTKTMVMSGTYGMDTVDFYIDRLAASSGTIDFYVLGVDVSNGGELMPKWVVYSKGDGDETPPILAKNIHEDVYISGLYSDDLGSGAFGNYTFPSIPGNNSLTHNVYQAKLSFLSREVTMDSSGRLSAVQDSAVYQWLDCGNGMQPVVGATSQSFQPAQPGSYAVRVSNSFCSVVSECISSTGISATDKLRQIGVYPNPVRETLYLSQMPLGTEIAVFDVLGRAVYSAVATKANLNISTWLWPPGVYMLRLSKDGATQLEKVVKE